jgi:Transmembrane secretion effector
MSLTRRGVGVLTPTRGGRSTTARQPAIYEGVRFRSASARTPLRSRNYRLYFSGQVISVPGTWLQTVAQAWLVLTLSSSAVALGVTVALQTVPVLALGAFTGSVADAVDTRRLLIGTQAMQGVLALVLGILALTGLVELWMVWILALGLGITRAFDTHPPGVRLGTRAGPVAAARDRDQLHGRVGGAHDRPGRGGARSSRCSGSASAF